MSGKIILRASGAKTYFSLFAGNSERILQSELYETKQAALRGAQAVQVNATLDGRYERLTSSDSKPYFVLRGANHEVIGVSETYSSQQARESGIVSCKLNGPTAEIVDRA